MRAHPLVVLPGVGAFGPAIDLLNSKGLATPLRERIGKNMSTLCVCLGFQLLAETSEEVSTTIGMGGKYTGVQASMLMFLIDPYLPLQSVGYHGLGIFPLQVVRFPGGVRVPQQGWNHIKADPRCRILKTGFAYFSNSFCLRSTPAGFVSSG